jgi:hypothetical protein
MSATRTITATDPVTGQTVTRRTARTYNAAVVWTAADGSLHAHAWAGRPDLAAAALAKVTRAGIADARLAPVTGDPWADAAWALEAAGRPVTPAAVAQAAASCPPLRTRYGATGEPTPPDLAALAADLGRSLGLAGAGHLPAARRVTLPGEPLPPAPPPPPAEPITLPELRAAAAAGRPVSLARLARALAGETIPPEPPAAIDARLSLPRVATLAQALAGDLATPGPTPDSLRARAVTRSAEGDRLAAAGDPDRAAAAVAHADALTAWADQLSPAPTGDAWAGQPWDPGSPDARARVALQGERVATLWPIAQALTGAGVTLPGSWATDGPVMAGEWPTDRALAALPIGAIATAAAALAALPPVTRAQARALDLCRGQGVAL